MRSTNRVEFDDYSIDTLDFDFTSSEGVQQFMRGTQTPVIQYEDASTTTKQEGRSVKMQVNEKIISDSQKGKGEEREENQVEYNQNDLYRFLKRVYPMINNALNTNIKALEYYQPKWTDYRKDIGCIYTLANALNKTIEQENQLEITDISWNCTGLIIAAAYGKFEQKGTSNERSFVCAWNLSKRNFAENKPSVVIETEVSLTCIQFHPTKPNILAGGSFNGEVFVWDLLDEEENLVCKSNIDEYLHREAVTQLQWNETQKQGSLQVQQSLFSLSTDGKILQWTVNLDRVQNLQENSLAYPTKGYFMIRKKEGEVVSVGGLCFAQYQEDKNNFIVGSEAGSVVRAQIDLSQRQVQEQQSVSQKLTWKPSTFPFMMNIVSKNLMEIKMGVEQYCGAKGIREIQLDHIFNSKPEISKLYPNPVKSAYEPHLGPVYSISFSPFYKSLFITSSLDGSVKLFDFFVSKSIYSVENFGNYIFRSEWSPKRPSVFGACMSNGEVIFYDLIDNKISPINIIEPKGMEVGAQALQLKFNNKQTDLVAVTYSKCQIKIYQLCDNLITPKKDELSNFIKIIEEMKKQ
ncbi:hypothetical protein ABPG72_016520 [Tetrahymena utriculariae]